MPLQLYPPGTRHRGTNKENRFYLAIGRVGGRMREFNTYATDEKAALRVARELEASINEGQRAVPDGGEITFAEAAKLYIEFRNPSQFDRQCIGRVISILGAYKIRNIRPADLHDMAIKIYPQAQAATRNRNALRPAITILNHAADAGLCDRITVKKFPEPPPKTRAVAIDTAAALIEAAGHAKTTVTTFKRVRMGREETVNLKGNPETIERDRRAKRLYLLWLFYQGNRVSAILRVGWDDINLKRRVVMMDIRKGKAAREKPLHDEVVAELLKVPEAERSGPVFPWRTRSGVRWVGDLLPGIRFTSHMGRHTHGSLLNAEGVGLRTIMESLDHSDPKSSIRYQAADIEIVRAAAKKIRIRNAG